MRRSILLIVLVAAIALLAADVSAHKVLRKKVHHRHRNGKWLESVKNAYNKVSDAVGEATDFVADKAKQVKEAVAPSAPVEYGRKEDGTMCECKPGPAPPGIFGKAWNSVKSGAQNAYNSAANAAGQAWDKTKDLAGQAYDAAGNAINRAGNAIGNAYDATVDAAGRAWDKTKDLAGQAYDAAGNAINSAGNAIANGARRAYDAAGNALDSAGNAIGNAYDAAGNAINRAGNAIANGARNAYDAAGNAINSAGNAIANGARRAYDAAGNALDAAGNAIRSAYGKVSEKAASMYDSIEDAAKRGATWIGQKASGAYARIQEGAKAAWDGAKSAYKKVADTAEKAAQWAGNQAERAWNIAKEIASKIGVAVDRAAERVGEWADGQVDDMRAWYNNFKAPSNSVTTGNVPDESQSSSPLKVFKDAKAGGLAGHNVWCGDEADTPEKCAQACVENMDCMSFDFNAPESNEWRCCLNDGIIGQDGPNDNDPTSQYFEIVDEMMEVIVDIHQQNQGVTECTEGLRDVKETCKIIGDFASASCVKAFDLCVDPQAPPECVDLGPAVQHEAWMKQQGAQPLYKTNGVYRKMCEAVSGCVYQESGDTFSCSADPNFHFKSHRHHHHHQKIDPSRWQPMYISSHKN